jgi:hypothetical protein
VHEACRKWRCAALSAVRDYAGSGARYCREKDAEPREEEGKASKCKCKNVTKCTRIDNRA